MEPYPMKWLRLYDEALNDPKVQRLPDSAFKCWINLLCLANQGRHRGRIVPKDIPYSLRLSEERATKMVEYFIEKELLEWDGDELVPHGWDARQFQSDNINERVAKHRRNVTRNVTSSLHVTPPDTDTDTDTEIPPLSPTGEGRQYTEDFQNFWGNYPAVTNNSKLKAWKAWQKLSREDRTLAWSSLSLFAAADGWKNGYIPHASTFLNARLWEDTEKATPAGNPSKNGHRVEEQADRRPTVPAWQPDAPKYMSPEKLAAIRAARRGTE